MQAQPIRRMEILHLWTRQWHSRFPRCPTGSTLSALPDTRPLVSPQEQRVGAPENAVARRHGFMPGCSSTSRGRSCRTNNTDSKTAHQRTDCSARVPRWRIGRYQRDRCLGNGFPAGRLNPFRPEWCVRERSRVARCGLLGSAVRGNEPFGPWLCHASRTCGPGAGGSEPTGGSSLGWTSRKQRPLRRERRSGATGRE